MKRTLESLRAGIDRLDEKIAGLLARRLRLAAELAPLKKTVRDLRREKEVLARVSASARKLNSDGRAIVNIYKTIILETRRSQSRLRLGLIGRPVSHSLSPELFSGLADYELLAVRPSELSAALKKMWDSGWDGFNVTMPLKEAAARKMSVLKGDAALLKAVNAVRRGKSGWEGHNTDAVGFSFALRENGVEIKAKRAAIWGAGGAAKAACLSLARGGAAEILILNRTQERAKKLAGFFRKLFPKTVFYSGPLSVQPEKNHTIWVNAAPAGRRHFPDGAEGFACDFVYTRPAGFSSLAKKRGLKIIGGKQILAYQASFSWEIWSGRTFEKSRMRKFLA